MLLKLEELCVFLMGQGHARRNWAKKKIYEKAVAVAVLFAVLSFITVKSTGKISPRFCVCFAVEPCP